MVASGRTEKIAGIMMSRTVTSSYAAEDRSAGDLPWSASASRERR